MKYYLCLDCFKIYDGDLLKYPYCPDLDCNSSDQQLVEIDELMIYPIIKLNQLGYYTRFCCSGHAYNDCLSTYIMFDSGYMPSTIPEGWVKDGSCIRYRPPEDKEWYNISTKKRQTIIFKAMKKLYDWCDNLEPCPYEEQLEQRHLDVTLFLCYNIFIRNLTMLYYRIIVQQTLIIEGQVMLE